MERDPRLGRSASEKSISTHTLTWSVTTDSHAKVGLIDISTHTLTWSVTLTQIFQPCTAKFQLTRSRGAWHISTWHSCRSKRFQLTRSRGAWLGKMLDNQLTVDFNSHAHVERDDGQIIQAGQIFISTHTLTWSVTNLYAKNVMTILFQLTRSRGAWRATVEFTIQILNFNSHAHVERDQFTTSFPHKKLNFNSHAHVERDERKAYLLC